MALLVAAVLALFAWMIHGVVTPLLVAGLVAIMLDPLAHEVARKLGRRAPWAPSLVTAGTLLLLVGPMLVIGILVFGQLEGVRTSSFAGSLQSLTSTVIEWSQRSVAALAKVGIESSTEKLQHSIETQAQNAIGWLGDYAGSALAAAPDLVVSAFLFVLALYFWLRDGHVFLRWLARDPQRRAARSSTLFDRVRDATRGIVVGQLVTGAVQALLALAFLFALRIPGAFLWGILAFVLSFIPLFGTAPVTLGAAIYLFAAGRVGAGLVMIVGALVIGFSDNVVRPFVSSGDGGMHPLVILVAIFGGIATLGPAGVLLGPVVAAIALWALELPRS